ncbi:SRPBCC family protein [Rhodanobacter sp. DHB23]|uniref:SRPBCC family protein n=1 Tax=Rhodanobacter sp. DHB23 TaxID=2775923 RepID=UPI001786BE8D|nr:SRPBCC family protein [Rhodanobacter sp. DHB23]MBD8871956.1 SRPBCC family protein [Rhodanobacter sp. DHB23]
MNGRIFLAVLACCLLAACGPSDDALAVLGGRGEIQQDAPVKASSGIVIDAPPGRVWNILVDAANWPRWLQGVSHVTVGGALGNGIPFEWNAGGTTIRSRVVLFVPDRTVAWTGKASLARAVHVLRLSAPDPGHTRVESMESMDGPLLSWFYSSSDLQASEDQMLKNLKAAAEAPLPLQGAR